MSEKNAIKKYYSKKNTNISLIYIMLDFGLLNFLSQLGLFFKKLNKFGPSTNFLIST